MRAHSRRERLVELERAYGHYAAAKKGAQGQPSGKGVPGCHSVPPYRPGILLQPYASTTVPVVPVLAGY